MKYLDLNFMDISVWCSERCYYGFKIIWGKKIYFCNFQLFNNLLVNFNHFDTVTGISQTLQHMNFGRIAGKIILLRFPNASFRF